MIPPTINHDGVLQLFQQLLHPQSQTRILRLLGDGKMGKTHLLNKVLPILVQNQPNLTTAWLDFKRGSQDIFSQLEQARTQFQAHCPFPTYDQACRDHAAAPTVQVKGLAALLSSISISSRNDGTSKPQIESVLTRALVDDLRQTSGQRLLLLVVDHVDPEGAGDDKKRRELLGEWLVNHLLVHLAQLPQVRVVMAGRTVPEPLGAYAPYCVSYELQPVHETDAYLRFCQQIGATLPSEMVAQFAYALDYAPGSFAEIVWRKYMPRGVGHG